MACSPHASGNEVPGRWAKAVATSTKRWVRRRSPSSASANSVTAHVSSSGSVRMPYSLCNRLLLLVFPSLKIPAESQNPKMWVKIRAHEEDAQRAVRTGLGMIEAMGQLNTRLCQVQGVHLAVRLGIHTGLVVVGEVGSGGRQEQLALGETPNIAARLQGLAQPNSLVVSAATVPLLSGFFRCQSLGTPVLQGLTQPLEVFQVVAESTARSRLEATASTGQTPLVDREQEVGLLLERWTRVKEGSGQVVLLSGEAGIGKSRLVQVLQEHLATEPQAWLTPCQCSPYHQNTALYPMIELLERVALRLEREETPQQKLSKLEGFLVQYGLNLAEAVPLFATLLLLPLPTASAALPLAPEQQKQ